VDPPAPVVTIALAAAAFFTAGPCMAPALATTGCTRKSRCVRSVPLLPWVVRVTWVVLPFTVGPVLATALDPRLPAVRTTASVGLWLVWAVVLVTTLVPRDAGLTVLRWRRPPPSSWRCWRRSRTAPGRLAGALAVSTALVAAAVAFLPEVGWLFVNGSAYGDERRHLLRAPGALLLGPLPLAWAALVVGLVAGPLLLASERWLAGGVATVVGFGVAAVVARALHSLTRRWAVLVPAGLVLKDHLAVLDPVLFRRTEVEVLRPAPADTDALTSPWPHPASPSSSGCGRRWRS
jgi:hypothetical protein